MYNKPVTGKYNLGRRQDAQILANFIAQGECISIYEPPKSGKRSLVQQTFFNMRVSSKKFTPIQLSLLNIRTIADLMMRLGGEVIKNLSQSPEGYHDAVESFLAGTHFVFDRDVWEAKEQILSLNWDIDDNDIRAILMLPYRMGAVSGQKAVVVLEEFQNVMQTEDGERVCNIFYEVLDGIGQEERKYCSYILMGSQLNAMKDIFEVKKLFYRKVEHLALSPIDMKDIIDHTVRGFLNSGKVLDRDLMLGVCKVFKGNIWYIQHFASICDSLSKGYMMEPVLVEALDMLISIHEPRFQAIMNDLTTYQVCLLRAILDGYTKFSSSEVIARYNLNSSANVRRLKDALCKKEIITFDEKDEPHVLDPLFEHWVRKYFFEMKGE